MSAFPKVSIIVPNYNHSVYLSERLDSILTQTYQDFEIIILDDCSTDNSHEVIEKYRTNSHVSHIVYNELNSGNTFIQWDKGITLARGRYIWIAESDDVAHPEFLQTLVSNLDCHPKAVLAFSHSFFIDDKGNDMQVYKHHNNDFNTVYVHDGQRFAHGPMLARNDIYNASMVVFCREIYSQLDKSFMQYRTCGDWAFWMNMCLHGQVIEVCRQLNYFRQHPFKVTRQAGTSGLDWQEAAAVLDSFVKLLKLKGLELSLFRGHWTKDFYESHYHEKALLAKEYTEVFEGSALDVFLYRLSKLPRRLLGSSRF